jgi:hypothetical protein
LEVIHDKARRQTVAADECVETTALEAFHHDEGPAVGVANLEDGADVGMTQRRGGSGLIQEWDPGKRRSESARTIFRATIR